ncbi:MAG: hypothetical protein CMB99_04925 [Flavobacteriaceae bacterium]|nr:hypothetical protein [Flavobacteriaceae bacterium]|tara:strand:+ start:119503 stop:120630 length:1128 start_codon:yes stop_codon:yes gene_type:complete
MAFKGTYFDGKTAKSHAADIAVSSMRWTISYTDNEQAQQVFWNLSEIKKSDVYTKDFLAFTYGKSFPFQRLESKDVTFINYLENQEIGGLNSKIDSQLHNSKRSSLVGLILGLIGLIFLIYLYVIPTVAESFASNMNVSRVIEFGDYVFRVLSSDLEIDDNKTKKLKNFVDELEIESEFPIEIYVAESNQLNAFALSGGKIVIFSALLEKMETKEQLVALIGHEISHIENRHVLKNVARNLSGALFVSIIFGDVNGVTTIMADNAHLFSQLSFSRKLEKEADIFGLEFMRKNAVDLHGMPELFKLLKRETNVDMPSYLSNHPMLKERIEYTFEIAEQQEVFEDNQELEKQWIILKSGIRDYEDDKNETKEVKENE